MEKIIITATAESIEQVKQLLEAGVDRIYVGEKDFGLRLPTTFSHEELREIIVVLQEWTLRMVNNTSPVYQNFCWNF